MSDTPTILPVPAATVLLLRDGAHGRIEVLLQRRHAALRFMGGLWVFPGGRLDPADRAPALLARARIPDRPLPPLLAADGKELPADFGRAMRIAACRETFEEAGVLLASAADGRACGPAAQAGSAALRQPGATAHADFRAVLETLDAWLDLEQLVYWSHWVTPRLGTQPRFDTRFYAVGLPAGQAACEDGGEATASVWLEPAEACTRALAGAIALAPPTHVTLEDLAEAANAAGSVAVLLRQQAGRSIPAVEPRLHEANGLRCIRMPWHPGFGDDAATAPAWPDWLSRRRAEFALPAAPG